MITLILVMGFIIATLIIGVFIVVLIGLLPGIIMVLILLYADYKMFRRLFKKK